MPDCVTRARRAALAAVLLALTVASGCDVLFKTPPCGFPMDERRGLDTTLVVGETARFYMLKGDRSLLMPSEQSVEQWTLADYPDDPDVAPYSMGYVDTPDGVELLSDEFQDLLPDSEVRIVGRRPTSGTVSMLVQGQTEACEGSTDSNVHVPGFEVEVVEAEASASAKSRASAE
jgi:hypothetical protein